MLAAARRRGLGGGGFGWGWRAAAVGEVVWAGVVWCLCTQAQILLGRPAEWGPAVAWGWPGAAAEAAPKIARWQAGGAPPSDAPGAHRIPSSSRET
jgi:hypothetical protein